MTPDLTQLAAAIAAVPDANQRATILTAVVDVLAKAEVDTTALTKSEADQFAAGKALARSFNVSSQRKV